MLFFINKSNPSLLKRIALTGADEDKSLVLVGDGVCFAGEFWKEQLQELAAEEIFVEKEALAARNIKAADNCELVSYSDIVDILFENEQVVSL